MKKFIFPLTIALLFAMMTLLSSCFSYQIAYNGLDLNLDAIKSQSVDLALLDHREVIVTRLKDPTFVGYMRSGYGIPYTFKTKSGNNFIDDLSDNIVNSFQKRNIKATKIQTQPENSLNKVKTSLTASGGDKKLLFLIEELHTDGYSNQMLYFNLTVSLYDKNGMLLKEKPFVGSRKVGGSGVLWGYGKKLKSQLSLEMKAFFEEVLNDEDILPAINTNTLSFLFVR